MSDEATRAKEPVTSKGGRNLITMAGLALAITVVLVGISLWLYKVTGTAQLDLSRPGYEREDMTQDDNSTSDSGSFSVTGEVTAETFEEFEKLMDKKSKSVRSLDAFKKEPLSDTSLGISSVSN